MAFNCNIVASSSTFSNTQLYHLIIKLFSYINNSCFTAIGHIDAVVSYAAGVVCVIHRIIFAIGVHIA